MSTDEMAIRFDVLYNNVASNQAPGLNSYEKSTLLTKAQDELLKNYFNPKSNPKQEGFDDNQKRQIDFSNLITNQALTPLNEEFSSITKFNSKALLYPLSNDVMFIINEQLLKEDGSTVQVIPLSYQEYTRLMQKPYREPYLGQAWRLLSSDRSIELLLRTPDKASLKLYKIRYIRKPVPIVLEDFPEGLSINGYNKKTECELDASVHEEILQRAVELAKASWQGDLNTEVQLGQRSE